MTPSLGRLGLVGALVCAPATWARPDGPPLRHGDADRTTPFAQGQKLFDAARGPKQFFRVAGRDHNDGVLPEYLRTLDRSSPNCRGVNERSRPHDDNQRSRHNFDRFRR